MAPEVAIFFGSLSDIDKMKPAAQLLKQFNIQYQAHALSAHRAPEILEETLQMLENQGCQVFIAGAGLAAHLPGVIASKTTKPVIGVPLNGALEGLDALLSIVQMPKEIPVACVGINNSLNAAMLAVQILALNNPNLAKALKDYRIKMKENSLKTPLGMVDL